MKALYFDTENHQMVFLDAFPAGSPPMEITTSFVFTADNRIRNRLIARPTAPITVTVPPGSAAYGFRPVITNFSAFAVTVIGTFIDSVTEEEITDPVINYGDTLEALGEFVTDSGSEPPPPGFLKNGAPYVGLGRYVYAFT